MSDSEKSLVFDEHRQAFTPYGLTCVRWRPSIMRKPDRHNEIELNFLESGSITYLLRGKRYMIRPRRLTLFWALASHQIIEIESDSPYYVATIPFTRFLQWNLPAKFINRVLQGEVLEDPSDSRASFDKVLFEQWLMEIEKEDVQYREIMLLEMEARLRRLALKCSVSETQGTVAESFDRAQVSKVEQMAMYVASKYTDPIKISAISKAVGLHPDYATALFKKTFGITLSEYLVEHRISHAQRMLVMSDEKITEIAFESGFNSISRFNAAFKKRCGTTPRRYRKNHHIKG